ncbi:MAG: inositol monophosphatase family protein [Bacteroidales bacterium]
MNSSDTYKKLCDDAIGVVREAADYVRGHHEDRKGLHVEKKGRQNFVTEVDKKAEQILVEGLHRVLPEAGFIAEEGTEDRRGETYNWVIDPIDGTTNFIHGVFPFAISVALSEKQETPAQKKETSTEKHEVVAGVVYEFGLDELFHTWKGGGAWLNGERIRVSGTPAVGQSLIATGFPYTNFTFLKQFMESMDYFMKNSNGLRRLGSAATDIAYVACGRFDGFYEYGLHPWDLAAGMLLVSEAGGRISDFNGNGDPLFGGDFVCTNDRIFEEFQGVIQKIMSAQ